jgi:hypothetical protein
VTDLVRRRPRRRAGTALTAATVLVVVALAALAKTSTGRQLATDLGLRGTSTGYTSLYFAHPGYLGTPIASPGTGQVRDRIAFGIQNEEHRAVDYSWTIQFSRGGRRYTGVVHVEPKASTTIARTVTLPCRTTPTTRGASARVNVRVSLAWPHDSIDFWQKCYE